MNNFKINELTFVTSDGDVNHPLVLTEFACQPDIVQMSAIKRIQMTVQIFHTDLKHFDLRKAVVVDPDSRRPIFIFNFDNVENHRAWMAKRSRYMLAFQKLDFIKLDEKITVFVGQSFGRDLYRLRSFTAWLEHVAIGQIESIHVQDCSVTSINGGIVLNVPSITFEDFIDCLTEEKSLVKGEPKSFDPAEETDIDGVKLRVDQIVEHMNRKATLEEMETCVAN